MDITQVQNLIGWMVGVFFVGILSIISGVLAVIKAGKMNNREIKGADLSNKSKEVSIADQFEEIATKAAEKTLNTQLQLDKLQQDYKNVVERLEEQAKLMSDQADIIDEQSNRLDEQEEIIKQQNGRIDEQDRKIEDQNETIAVLECKLNNSEAYNKALIEQMKNAEITPVDLASTKPEDCSKASMRREEKRGKFNNTR